MHEVVISPEPFEAFRKPSTHSPTDDSLYEGAGRGEMMDALIYVLTHGEGPEGLIRIIGAPGVGKTTLCRSLIKRLPRQMQPIYLCALDLSEEAFLRAIACDLAPRKEEAETDLALGLDHASGHSVSMEGLQALLAAKRAGGRQILLVIDEAHAMSAEVLKSLGKLYDSQFHHHKSLQIILIGQKELDDMLASLRMPELTGKVSHRFVLRPLDERNVEDYLMWWLRVVNHPYPITFSAGAAKLIVRRSGGLIRGLNTLAVKSLQAAGAVSAREIERQHVMTITQEANAGAQSNWRNDGMRSVLLNVGGVVAVLSLVSAVALGVYEWQSVRPRPVNLVAKSAWSPQQTLAPDALLEPLLALPLYAPPDPHPTVADPTSAAAGKSPATSTAPIAGGGKAATVPGEKKSAAPAPAEPVKKSASSQQDPAAEEHPRQRQAHVAGVGLAGYGLLKQRIEATKKLAAHDGGFITIQLFATNNIQPDRMERFLARAQKLVDLSEIYVHTINDDSDQARFRVTYGIYATREEADTAMAALPEKYQSSFQLTLYTLSELD